MFKKIGISCKNKKQKIYQPSYEAAFLNYENWKIKVNIAIESSWQFIKHYRVKLKREAVC